MPSRRKLWFAASSVDHVSVEADWEGLVKSAYTFSPGSIQPDGTDSGLRVVDAHKFTGDFSVTFTWTAGATNEVQFGVYKIDEDGVFNAAVTGGGLNSMTNSWWYSNNNWRYGGASQKVSAFANDDTGSIKRVGDVFTGYINGSLDHTYGTQDSGEVRLMWGCGNSSAPVVSDLRWVGGG